MIETVNEQSSALRRVSTTKVSPITTVSSECKICGAPARYSYYGVVVCQSCKMFFKRNAEAGQVLLKCHFDNECNINMNNRHTCSSCRLAKCFASGMCIEMIRSSRPKNKNRKKKSITNSKSTALVVLKNKKQPDEIPTLNLLRSDQSTLNMDQWNLLSNLVHCFDEYNGYSLVQGYIKDQNALPAKLRFRYSSVKDFFTWMVCNVQLVFEKNRDFLSVSSQDRVTLLRTTVEYTSSIGGLFILRQSHLFDDPSFFKSTETIFRPSAVASAKRVIDELDPDDTFIKLILGILSFTTINYTVYSKLDPTNLTNIKVTLPIQDMYTELAWRYILYKYGHYEAVKHFSNLIRCLFFMNAGIVDTYETQQFTELIDSVIERTEKILSLE